MSLNELLELKRKPWCDIEVEDLYVDGTLYYNHISPIPVGRIMPYQVGPTGFQYQTIQSAINSANETSPSDDNPAYIYVYPGTYEEDLTLYGGILIFGLGDNTQNQITINKFLNTDDFSFNNNAVQILGNHIVQTTGNNSVNFNNITFLTNTQISIFNFNNGVNTQMSFNYCNIYLIGGSYAFYSGNFSSNILNVNNTYIGTHPISFSNVSLVNFEQATDSNGSLMTFYIENSTIYTTDVIDLISGINSIYIYCDSSSFICSITASLSNSATAYCNFINSFVTCSAPQIDNAILSNLHECNLQMINCYCFPPTGIGSYQGPFVKDFSASNSVSLIIFNCYYPDLVNISTNVLSDAFSNYKISNLKLSSYWIDNTNNYLYQIGTSPNGYQVQFIQPSASRLLTYYDPLANCNMKLGIDYIAGSPSVGSPLNLTSAMSGSIIPVAFFGGAINLQINLPTLLSGLNYKIILNDVHLTGSILTISATGALLNGVLISGAGGEAQILEKTNIIFTNGAINQTGSIIEFLCGGTTWCVRATVINGSEWSFT